MLLDLIEEVEEVLAHKTLWRYVEQVELAIYGCTLSLQAFGGAE